MPSPILPARTFKQEEVTAWFGDKAVEKAATCIGAVSHLHVSDHEISALVQGTARRPYTVRITFPAGRRQILAACTCPVGSFCKHGAATMLAAVAQRGVDVARPSARVLEWMKDLRSLVDVPADGERKQRERLFYFLECAPAAGQVEITLRKGRPLANGTPPPSAEPWSNFDRALITPPSFVSDEDLSILRLLWLTRDVDLYRTGFHLASRKADDIFTLLLASGRCYLNDTGGPALRLGSPRSGSLTWATREDGLLHPEARVEGRGNAMVMATNPPWYLDAAKAEIGPLRFDVAPALVLGMLKAPGLRPIDAALVAREIAGVSPHLPSPDTRATENLPRWAPAPIPRLRLLSATVATHKRWRGYEPMFGMQMDLATPSFDYGGVEVTIDDEREFRIVAGKTARLVRDRNVEAAALAALNKRGFESVPAEVLSQWHPLGAQHIYGLAGEAAWADWYARIAPALRTAGWQLEIDRSFRHHVAEIDHIEADIDEAGPGWLNLGLGFELDGHRVALAPLLSAFLQEHPQWSSGAGLDSLQDGARVELTLDDGGRIRVLAGRIKPLLRLLIDLFDGGGEVLRVSTLDAPRLRSLAPHVSLNGGDTLQAALERLSTSGDVAPVAAPPGLGLSLRPYQLEGLAWLQHLRTHGLGGILADDMGLGKTAQTLAHILCEKQGGRADLPSLVVLPTSLVFNWKREAQRIAPALRVLVLHGPQRDFTAIPLHDVVLTTYPLVWRDAEALRQHEFHLLILDEAQTVKNAASKAAGVVRELRARHRLCLTGTPMENHLGELWTQFDFILPGFLGEQKDFTRRWRNPIEKEGDGLRRELLARRVKPFILRRRKDEVAKELPPKTVVLRTVELEGGQRDLYEIVRSAMDAKVREVITAQGIGRSQIVILDALLKLRQVCCDPRLLGSPAASTVQERAKLDLLMQMLPELVEEGRRILVFSQFTSMLDLIGEAVDALGIAYVRLTGKTKDRETPVRQFQNQEVPLFLISLKAGGVGLNLTQADTVIHFDPWWNPAVEEQASDRAHRIGQTKPVFVYKLVVAGSIEERILALQERKAELAGAILSEDAEGSSKFAPEDLEGLFAPLPATTSTLE